MKENFAAIVSQICFYDEKEITMELSLFDDLALSSVMMVELIAELEFSFHISLENKMNDIINCVTTGDLFQVVLKACEEQNS